MCELILCTFGCRVLGKRGLEWTSLCCGKISWLGIEEGIGKKEGKNIKDRKEGREKIKYVVLIEVVLGRGNSTVVYLGKDLVVSGIRK